MSELASEFPATVSPADREAIIAVLSRYVEVVDNGAWEEERSVFTPGATLGASEGPGQPIAALHDMYLHRPVPLFPHQCTDIVLTPLSADRVRAWSKFFTVRADGSVTSGDYLDTIVRGAAGDWRIAHRATSLGNRPPTDPFGPSARVFSSQEWRTPAQE